MAKKKSEQPEAPLQYIPSEKQRQKLSTNRLGKITTAQRIPIVVVGFISAASLICPITISGSVLYSIYLGINPVGIFAWILALATLGSFGFLAVVLWVNAHMFFPEALSRRPVRWEKAPLSIRLAGRERTEMPFSYIIGSYSFAPFIAPDEVPLQRGREYIVYYTPRSRLLLSIAPTDQPESAEWLPPDVPRT